MPGTKIGGMKAAKSNKERHGDNFYKEVGRLGGKAKCKKPKGFAANPELARKAGLRGGRIGKRGPARSGIVKA